MRQTGGQIQMREKVKKKDTEMNGKTKKQKEQIEKRTVMKRDEMKWKWEQEKERREEKIVAMNETKGYVKTGSRFFPYYFEFETLDTYCSFSVLPLCLNNIFLTVIT